MPRLKPTPKELDLHPAQLAETLNGLRGMAAGLSEDDLHWSPGKKDWSIVEVLAHIRACAEVWTYSIDAMLAENQPALPLIDERRWAKTLGYATLSFEASFTAFAIQREELLRVLRGLTPDQWERTCQIEGRSHSVFSQVRGMALHEVEHLQQCRAVVAALELHRQP